MSAPRKTPRKLSVLRRIAAALGPGVITGDDDDPSGSLRIVAVPVAVAVAVVVAGL